VFLKQEPKPKRLSKPPPLAQAVLEAWRLLGVQYKRPLGRPLL
jgi:hypothetical protein